MRQKVVYECEFCITRREYLDWRMLNKDAAEAGKRMGLCNDKIMNDLIEEDSK